jgi:hypothetical protein
LSGIGGGEGAGRFAADVAVEGGDAVLDGGLDGLRPEGAVPGDAALQRGAHGRIIGYRSRGSSAFAARKGQGERDGGYGGQDVRFGLITVDVHKTPFLAASTWVANGNVLRTL